ncbi:Protein FAR1-RELATED SEQUENCE 5 [Morella rubra]|uniref:Protein FAR1-RELATED SEQUENCE 5 n=1 Tax=Morella rubra TaxID=262757 RepID=A0A6A1UU91_9ROSI|nr:Protein FAR1-RELATED SEQUENCE 5 [Morella rubra]
MVRADNGEAINIWTLEFRDDEHAYDWYNRYAISAGFSIRRHAGFKNKEKGYYTSRSFVCSKEGLRKEKEQDVPAKKERWNTRCGCLASFTIQRQSSGKYFTFDWCAQHNHELATPTKAHLLRSHRRINKLQHHECDNADIANIPLKLANDLRAAQVGGKEHLKIDLKHHLSNRRSKSMGVGVACALLNWFGDPHRNSQFFFRVMLDDDEQISNVFWCDRSMQNDFALFWDFVLFDTTYMTNSEHRPLGAFLGVNNHRELVVFGACLLFDETIQSFKWLFETFVECMEGKTPQSLFTDQDAEMLAAIPTALPDTHHFLCVWQINQYALKNLGSLFDNRDFKKDWNKLLFDNDVDDFDLVWSKMIDDHDLHDNEWLQTYMRSARSGPQHTYRVFSVQARGLGS